MTDKLIKYWERYRSEATDMGLNITDVRFFEKIEETILALNTRTPDPVVAGVVEALELAYPALVNASGFMALNNEDAEIQQRVNKATIKARAALKAYQEHIGETG